MKRPIKLCIICKTLLTGYQKKYCSRTCGEYVKAKKQHRKFMRELGPRKCPVCKTSFMPKRANNIYCKSDCLKKNQEKARRSGCLQITNMPENIILHNKPHFNQNCSQNKSAIEYDLKNGGKISSLPVAPSGKAPDVNFKYAWVPTEIYGNGLLYELGEEHE